MTVRTRPPVRLPAAVPPREQRRREIRLGLLGVLGLLVAVAGIPVALALAVGNPLPTSGPSSDWLTADVSATLVVKVLTCAVWVAWAHFAVCVLSEWRALRSGRLPTDVPLGGGSQLVARRLVAAALLLAGAATLAPTSAPSSVPTPSVSVTSTVAAATVQASAVQAAPVADKAVTGGKTYAVQPPEGRRYDCLWDIAERTLGDPLRWKEIFALNADRVQADGAKLVDADLIRPGWVLSMPADAVGEGVTVPQAAPLPQQAPAPAPAPVRPAAPAVEAPAAEAPAAPTAEAAPAQAVRSTEQVALGAGLLAAGLLAALTARRGPYAPPADSGAEGLLRVSADPGRADLLDRGLRRLAADCAASGTPLPEVALAMVGEDLLALSLTAPSVAPPGPWTADEQQRVWTLTPAALGDAPAPDVAAPYPALAGVGRAQGYDVLVDLEGAPGLVSLSGDLVASRECAVSLAVELVTNTWSDGVLVTLVGFGDDLTAVDPARITPVDRLSAALDELEAEAAAGDRARRALGVTGVLSGRLARGAERRPPRVVVLSGVPLPEEADRLRALVHAGRTPLAVVVVGDAPGASWRFLIGTDGRLDLGVLGQVVEPHRLSPAQYVPLVELLRQADDERRTAAGVVPALTPRAAADGAVTVDLSVAGDPLRRPAPFSALAPSPLHPDAAPVAVRLLGPVEVSAPGAVDPAARPLLTELVVSVALHRHTAPGEGLHEAVLRAEVWPRGVGDDVVTTTVAQVQAWLGAGPDGPRLRQDADGRFVLGADVACDLDVLLDGARRADGPREESVLRALLGLVRGTACDQVPAGRYAWLAFHRAAREARVTGTAVARRAAALAVARGDRTAAEHALRTGLQLVPGAEPLWRDLLRLAAADGAADGVALEARSALAGQGLQPEPETDALLASLAPGVPGPDVRRVTG